MAGFNFDEMDQIVNESEGKINFLKLKDDGWYAKVRFMYGPGETIGGQTVHNVAEPGSNRPKYVPCLREVGQPIETCPLCKAGAKITCQFFVPVYVISIVSNLRGVTQEEPVGQVMLFQKGTTFGAALKSVIRQTQNTGKPIVSSVFNLVRNGKEGDQKTQYSVELIGTDDTTLDMLPPRPQVLGSYILPNITFEEMQQKYVNGAASQSTQSTTQTTQAAQPTFQQTQPQVRTLNAGTFAGNTVMGQPNNVGTVPSFNQVSATAPQIGGSSTPF